MYVHAADAPLVRRDSATINRFREQQVSRFTDWGITDDKLEELLAHLDRNEEIYGPRGILEKRGTAYELDGDPADVTLTNDGA